MSILIGQKLVENETFWVIFKQCDTVILKFSASSKSTTVMFEAFAFASWVLCETRNYL